MCISMYKYKETYIMSKYPSTWQLKQSPNDR